MAFTCVPVVAQWGTVSYIHVNQASCVAGEWAVFTAADLSAYTASITAAAGTTGTASADLIALQAQVISMQTSIATIATNQGYLPSVFDMPSSVDIATAWMIGFSIPMILYLVSWGYGTVVNSFSGRDRG